MHPQHYPAWFEQFWNLRKTFIGIFAVLFVLSAIGLPQLKFNFSFEQFFPNEDEDLEFFMEFVEDFETDDNFLLLAFERKPDIFNAPFLQKVDSVASLVKTMPHVQQVQSLTQLKFPRKTAFGPVPVRLLDWSDSTRLARAAQQLPTDPRFSGRLISESGTDIIVFVKTDDNLTIEQARELRAELDPILNEYAPQPVRILGRAYITTELVDMQIWEVGKSSVIAAALIAIVMFFLFRKRAGILISLTSILVTLFLFFGYLAWTGRSLSVMAALFPIIMIIVGTSDVIHIMSKYLDEGARDKTQKQALFITIKEIGLATFLTSITTAIGFASLSYSRITSIQEFGYNAAVGVLIAYVTVIFFTSAWLSFYEHSTLRKQGKVDDWWSRNLMRVYAFTRQRSRWIWWSLPLGLAVALWGISLISTNYNITDNLPEGYKITRDFKYFERVFGGYRPYEYALEVKDEGEIWDYEKMKAISDLESYLKGLDYIQRVNGPAEVFAFLHMYENRNQIDSFKFPPSQSIYADYKDQLSRLPANIATQNLIGRKNQKARVSSTVKDIGADSVKWAQDQIRSWFKDKAEEANLSFKATGTGVILDKNSEYVRSSLLSGLLMAVGIVSLIMALLFRSGSMLFIALVPNIVPLVMAGALLGFTGTELEAGIAIIFAVVFGIAVDDTIHFLSKYKLARNKGLDQETALQITFTETGKAILLTSIILFAGFMILFFSVHPPTRTVGWLIAITLVSALAADVLIIPLLLRRFGKKL
ncbi:MAG: MMPL family transporter [Bacteroidetes bacterium]|jgi:predicted RND superfamily exporter protein|nr:MMPL family transporter [Bacteroidota bacterium]